jgi:alkaline phosphatase D
VFTFDDHEVCDNTWKDGGVNHQPATEGSFAARKKQAYQAYLEWVPLRLPDQTGATGTRFWRRFQFGDLADLSVLETRQNRSEQLAIGDESLVGDPTRHLPEPAQMSWLTSGLRTRKTWHLVGNQVVLSQLRVPSTPTVVGMLTDLLPGLSSPVPTGGYVFNTDQWDGYGADQAHLLSAMAAAKTGDTVVFTGDIHSSWANDLPLDAGSYVPGVAGVSAGTEYVCPSVTSDGFYEVANRQTAGALGLADAIKAANRNVRYLDGIGHGFCVADVTPQRVRVDFVHLTSTAYANDPRLDPRAGARVAASWQSVHGERAVSQATTAMGPRSDQPRRLPVPRRTVRTASAAAVTAGPELASTGGSELVAGVGAAALLGLAAVRARLR